MLKELFESSFYITFPQKNNVTLALEEKVLSDRFILVDPNACRDCRNKCSTNENEREQLVVNAKSNVHVISLDDVFSYVKAPVGDNCDYMLDDDGQVILVEMTCTSSDYIGNKRVKARSQLYNTLCLLNTNPDLRKHLDQKGKRSVVFSWRETMTEMSDSDTVEGDMRSMMGMVDEVYSPDNISKFDFGFLFREIRYPDVLVW